MELSLNGGLHQRDPLKPRGHTSTAVDTTCWGFHPKHILRSREIYHLTSQQELCILKSIKSCFLGKKKKKLTKNFCSSLATATEKQAPAPPSGPHSSRHSWASLSDHCTERLGEPWDLGTSEERRAGREEPPSAGHPSRPAQSFPGQRASVILGGGLSSSAVPPRASRHMYHVPPGKPAPGRLAHCPLQPTRAGPEALPRPAIAGQSVSGRRTRCSPQHLVSARPARTPAGEGDMPFS